MLEVGHLTRRYGDFTAVDDVSFSIQQGEIVGLLGHNGAGKTTIMKMITGYLEPDDGEVKLNGVALSSDPKVIQQQLGYLPESLPVYPEMSVIDYLDYAAELKGLAGELKRSEIKRVVAATDLQQKLLSPIANLSRGYKQRVGVAQAILGNPKLLILDEPTNGLDPEQTKQMRELIMSLAESATVILSTHIMQEVEAVCSRVLIVNSGRLVVDETLKNLTNSQQLIVSTNAAKQSLEQLDSVETCETIDEQVYRIGLSGKVSQRQAAHQIAKWIINNENELYTIRPETRDLESLFHSASQLTADIEGGMSHAA